MDTEKFIPPRPVSQKSDIMKPENSSHCKVLQLSKYMIIENDDMDYLKE